MNKFGAPKNWANEESSDDEDVPTKIESTIDTTSGAGGSLREKGEAADAEVVTSVQELDVQQPEVSGSLEADEETEDDEEDSDDDEDTQVPFVEAVVEKKAAPKKPLSKKEQKELKKQELDELDQILSEFGVQVAQDTNTDGAVSEEVQAVSSTSEKDDKDGKLKKKKKKTQSKPAPVPQEAGAVDVASILKSKLKKNKKADGPQSEAIKEALKVVAEVDSKKKKGKDKSKKGYSETSY